MPEYGIFSEDAGGCIYAPCYSAAEARRERVRLIEEGEDKRDLSIHELCPEHSDQEQPKHGCEECEEESDE